MKITITLIDMCIDMELQERYKREVMLSITEVLWPRRIGLSSYFLTSHLQYFKHTLLYVQALYPCSHGENVAPISPVPDAVLIPVHSPAFFQTSHVIFALPFF